MEDNNKDQSAMEEQTTTVTLESTIPTTNAGITPSNSLESLPQIDSRGTDDSAIKKPISNLHDRLVALRKKSTMWPESTPLGQPGTYAVSNVYSGKFVYSAQNMAMSYPIISVFFKDRNQAMFDDAWILYKFPNELNISEGTNVLEVSSSNDTTGTIPKNIVFDTKHFIMDVFTKRLLFDNAHCSLVFSSKECGLAGIVYKPLVPIDDEELACFERSMSELESELTLICGLHEASSKYLDGLDRDKVENGDNTKGEGVSSTEQNDKEKEEDSDEDILDCDLDELIEDVRKSIYGLKTSEEKDKEDKEDKEGAEENSKDKEDTIVKSEVEM
jgi:hypothetical protein